MDNPNLTSPLPSGSVTSALSRHLSGLCYERLPEHVVERAKDLILDHLGVGLYSASLPWSAIVRAQAVADGGPPEAALYGGKSVALRNAVMANATTAHGIELDDTHDESLSHPGAVVIPPCLALMQQQRLHGRQVIAAIVAGYDAQCRVGSAAGKPLILGGFHPTSSNGVFGAAGAAANLLGLAPLATQSALGIALSMASGVMQFSQDASGTMVKRLHAGIPAERGLFAAQLAQRGFAGPAAAIEGRYGFVRVFAGHSETGRVLADLGERFEIEAISVKLYACCRLFHALIDAIIECRDRERFGIDEIVSVIAFGPRLMFEQHMEYVPDSVMSAQYSLPYTVAATLLFDPKKPDVFGEAHFRRDDALRLAALVTAEHDVELEELCPVHFPAGVRIRLTDGRVVQQTVLDSKGTPARPLTRAAIVEKFRALSMPRINDAAVRSITDAVSALDADGGAECLVRILTDPCILAC